MKTSEAIALLNLASPVDLARELRITPSAIYQWPNDEVPLLRQYQVRELLAARQNSTDPLADRQAA